MYSVDGDFGKVRLASRLPTQTARAVLNYTTSAGWHRCNDKYRISLDEGACDTWLVLLTVRGCGQLFVGGAPYLLPEATAGIVPAGAAREYFVPQGGQWEFYWLHLGGPQAVAILAHLASQHGHCVSAVACQAAMAAGIEELILAGGRGSEGEVHVSQVISGMMHELLACAEERGGGRRRETDPVREMMRQLEANYNGKVSVDGISRSLFVNTAHLARLFKARTGFTPYEYLTRYRIMRSKELLLYTDLPVCEVARRSGFPRPSNFISRFKALELVTPQVFRKRAG